MDKKLIRGVIATVLGIALLIALTSTFSLIFDAIMANDVTVLSSVSNSMEQTISYMRNTAIGVVCVNAAMLAAFCFTYFTNAKKVFGCIAAGLSLLSAAMCIAFVFDLRAIVLESTRLENYTAATSYFSELITLAATALLFCAYFTYVTVKAFLHKTETTLPENTTEEVGNEEN